MPFQKGHKLSGKNAGRKSARDEGLKNKVIENAWRKKLEKLDESEAIQIVLKDMTVKTDAKSTVLLQQITGMEILTDENPIQDENSEAN